MLFVIVMQVEALKTDGRRAVTIDERRLAWLARLSTTGDDVVILNLDLNHARSIPDPYFVPIVTETLPRGSPKSGHIGSAENRP
jgi:hypothetical protein